MEISDKKRFHKLVWFWNILRNGLFLHGLTNRLDGMGLGFIPYYWVEENVVSIEEPKIGGDSSGFSVSYFGTKEYEFIKENANGFNEKELSKSMKDGHIFLGLKKNGEIAAYVFIQNGGAIIHNETIKLKEGEGYLHNLYSFQDFRGQNLAAYLRYHSYRLASEKGVDKIYSISEYLNKSSVKALKKMNAKILELRLDVHFIKRIRKRFLLKKYL